jgi:hypothetical protein
MTVLTPEILDDVRYTTEEHCCAHFADMIDSGQGIGTSDISICANEIIEYYETGYGFNEENFTLGRGLVIGMINETLVEMENEYA